MTVTFQTPQAPVPNMQRAVYQGHPVQNPHPVPQPVQQPPATASQMLDMYYTSLCQPAFPEPGWLEAVL